MLCLATRTIRIVCLTLPLERLSCSKSCSKPRLLMEGYYLIHICLHVTSCTCTTALASKHIKQERFSKFVVADIVLQVKQMTCDYCIINGGCSLLLLGLKERSNTVLMCSIATFSVRSVCVMLLKCLRSPAIESAVGWLVCGLLAIGSMTRGISARRRLWKIRCCGGAGNILLHGVESSHSMITVCFPVKC